AHERVLGRRLLATNRVHNETGPIRAFGERRERGGGRGLSAPPTEGGWVQARANAVADAEYKGGNGLLSVLRFTQTRGREYYYRHLRQVPATRSEVMAANSHIEWTEATWNPVTG